MVIHIDLQIKELGNKRDTLDQWLLDRGECQEIIEYLSTL